MFPVARVLLSSPLASSISPGLVAPALRSASIRHVQAFGQGHCAYPSRLQVPRYYSTAGSKDKDAGLEASSHHEHPKIEREESGLPRESSGPAPKHFRDTTPQTTLGPVETLKESAGSQVKSSRPHEDWVLFHPVYTKEELDSVKIVLSTNEKIADKIADLLVRMLRKGFDLVTGYKHTSPGEAMRKLGPDADKLSLKELREKGIVMTEGQWMFRILFLETIAGVPGMVGAMLRHLRSLRMMGRDGGWIHKLLEEAENERMHLMTFMKVKKPSVAFRILVLGAQGVFFNLFFLAYVLSPRYAHRFVGKLEEEAVKTYTFAIEEYENGRVPEWKTTPVPTIAKDYWRLGDDATFLDLLRVVRADEATHRFVNHSLANLKSTTSFNPFAMREPDASIKGSKVGFTEEESIEWAKKVQEEFQQKKLENQKLNEEEKKN